jgi:hypothetical protein
MSFISSFAVEIDALKCRFQHRDEFKTKFFFFPLYFYGLLCICTSAAPQRPAHGTVPSQVATHLRTDRVCRVLGRSWNSTWKFVTLSLWKKNNSKIV